MPASKPPWQGHQSQYGTNEWVWQPGSSTNSTKVTKRSYWPLNPDHFQTNHYSGLSSLTVLTAPTKPRKRSSRMILTFTGPWLKATYSSTLRTHRQAGLKTGDPLSVLNLQKIELHVISWKGVDSYKFPTTFKDHSYLVHQCIWYTSNDFCVFKQRSLPRKSDIFNDTQSISFVSRSVSADSCCLRFK